ncbi:MAG: hypothetical protein ACREX4_13515 [Gammaproteobacteria bacterium]
MTWTLSFLAASDGTPLAKHYTLQDGVLEKSSYPNILYFDSHVESIRSLPEFKDTVTKHAEQGHCLLKGPGDFVHICVHRRHRVEWTGYA